MYMQTITRQMTAALLAASAVLAALAPRLPGATDKFAGVPARLQPLIESGQLSGAVALVATKARILQVSAVGNSGLETGRMMRTDDLFWIAASRAGFLPADLPSCDAPVTQ
jgi:hypothetical protein